MRAQVFAARAVQAKRFGDKAGGLNGRMTSKQIRTHCVLDGAGRAIGTLSTVALAPAPLSTGVSDLARQIAGRCHVVFITAFDQHALEAFEAGAIDYVLKPFNEERLALTVERLQGRLQGRPAPLEARRRRGGPTARRG